MAQIIDGKIVSASIRAEIAREVAHIKKERGGEVGLAVVLVGENPASQVYVRLKERACGEVGIRSFQHTPPANISMEALLALIDQLNNDAAVNGILVQLPLPEHLDSNLALDRIRPDKDVDGFHPHNVGLLSQNLATLMPCTPLGVMELLDRAGIAIEGANVVVVGRSNIVGKPVAAMLLSRNATVTICHSRSKNLGDIVRRADIVVAAVGKPEMITGEMIKPGAAVIDVGVNRVGTKLVGDVHFESASKVAGWITPVPGGVGPMTITRLLETSLTAYKLQRGLVVDASRAMRLTRNL